MDNKYDLKVILFHVGEKGKTSHKAVNLNSFIETVNKPVIQERLKDGKLYGLLTHEGRARAREANIPHHDVVMKDPDLCNILRKITIKDNVVYGYLDLVPGAPAAERFKSLWKMGSKIGVSMSTELIEDTEFIIKELLGVDLTCRSEFDSPIVEANFSEQESHNPDTIYQDGEFSVEVDPTEEVLLGHDFSEGDFSIRDYLRERERRPALVLRQRLNEVIRYIKMARPNSVKSSEVFLRRYILEYVNEWVMMAVNDPSSDLNIGLGLRLNEYCKDRTPVRRLQMDLRRAKQQLKSGSMLKDVQINLNKDFAEIMNQIFDYINSKVNNEDKAI